MHSWKPSFARGSSERSKVALRSREGRGRGVEQFCRAEGPRGTRLLMTVAGQKRGDGQGEGALFPVGVLGPHGSRASGRVPLLRQGRRDWRWRLVPRFGAGGLSGSEGLGLLLFFSMAFLSSSNLPLSFSCKAAYRRKEGPQIIQDDLISRSST